MEGWRTRVKGQLFWNFSWNWNLIGFVLLLVLLILPISQSQSFHEEEDVEDEETTLLEKFDDIGVEEDPVENHEDPNLREDQGHGGLVIGETTKVEISPFDSSLPFPSKTDPFWEPEEEEEEQEQKSSSKGHVNQEEGEPDTTKNVQGPLYQSKPNIVLILTDDQDVELGSMDYMPETLRLFREGGGLEFRHAYVTTPMCCPSRTSILTGLYVHNHHVYTNNGNCSSEWWRRRFEEKTFGASLQSSGGYYTAYIGKYLNKYDGTHIPQGWDEWNGLLMNSKFYNYTVNRNGKRVRYGGSYERDYYPDSIANDTLDFLTRMANPDDDSPRTKTRRPGQPFLLVVSFPSPHGPEDAAPQHSGLFLNVTSHHTPAYNYAPNQDKQWILRVTPPMSPIHLAFTNLLNTRRLQTLQSVDSAMKEIGTKLSRSGLNRDTYLFYTSDHGYHVGQFGLLKGKGMPFEFDIRVPFYVLPPRRKSRVRRSDSRMVFQPVLNIDLAPTFLEIAGLRELSTEMDGRSIVPLLNKYTQEEDINMRTSPEEGVHDWTHTFLIESSGRRELNSINNEALKSRSKKSMMMGSPGFKILEDGSETFYLEPEEEEFRLLELLCNAHPYPCLQGQKKYCARDGFDRVRFRKCRSSSSQHKDKDPEKGFNSKRFNSKSKCPCPNKRHKRSPSPSTTELDIDQDWEVGRSRIDSEIEELKMRIEALRAQRRELKNKWMLKKSSSSGDPKEVLEIIPKETSSKDLSFGSDLFLDKDGNVQVGLLGQDGVLVEPEEEIEDDNDEESKNPTKSPRESISVTENPLFTRTETVVVDDPHPEDPEDKSLTSGIHSPSPHPSTQSPDLTSESEDHWLSPNPDPDPECECDGVEGEDQEEHDPEGEVHIEGDLNPKILQERQHEERRRKKLMSRLRKKQRLLHRLNNTVEREQAESCGKEEKVNCFWHDQAHWRTEPRWSGPSFCFCMNSFNNSYSCLRSINSTHNYLYCLFTTGFKMYFDLRVDPYELTNLIGTLNPRSEEWMFQSLLNLQSCSGQCWAPTKTNPNPTNKPESERGKRMGHGHHQVRPQPELGSRRSGRRREPISSSNQSQSSTSSIWEQIFGRERGRRGRKKDHGHGRGLSHDDDSQKDKDSHHHETLDPNGGGRRNRKWTTNVLI